MDRGARGLPLARTLVNAPLRAGPPGPPPEPVSRVKPCLCGSVDLQITWRPAELGHAAGYAVRCNACGRVGPWVANGSVQAWNEDVARLDRLATAVHAAARKSLPAIGKGTARDFASPGRGSASERPLVAYACRAVGNGALGESFVAARTAEGARNACASDWRAYGHRVDYGDVRARRVPELDAVVASGQRSGLALAYAELRANPAA